jgi:hypothetical protein
MFDAYYVELKGITRMSVHYLCNILEWVCQTLYLQEDHGVRFEKHMGMIPIISP